MKKQISLFLYLACILALVACEKKQTSLHYTKQTILHLLK